MPLAPDEFPPEKLQHRLEFVTGRAEVHLANLRKLEDPTKNVLHQACAATLYRDAACVALLLESVRTARDLLHKSGSLFLALGLPFGATLVALAGQVDADTVLNEHIDVLDSVRQQWGTSKTRERRDFHRPMIDHARSEPRQLLAMTQADWIWDDKQEVRASYKLEEPLKVALKRNGGHPAGTTGLSIDSYSMVGEWFVERRDFDENPPDRVAAVMMAMMAIRAEHLHAARKDSYHWRLLVRPTELVDLDAVILMYLATKEDGSPKTNLEQFIDRRQAETPLLDAPMKIASLLRRDQQMGA